MNVVIMIPARYGSTRYPGKPLVKIKGADGEKTLIQRTWETGMGVAGAARVLVATDDERIADCVRGFGGEAMMTSESCRNGTERCAEAMAFLGEATDMVVNLQGDAPLTPPWFLEDLIAALDAKPAFRVATPVLRCDTQTYESFREDRAAGRVGGTTATFAQDGRALYFSKEVVPYLPPQRAGQPPVYHHVGVYAYRPDALARYSTWAEGQLEQNEGLEQLRFLENGEDVLCVEVDAKGRPFWELNNPVDLERIEAVL